METNQKTELDRHKMTIANVIKTQVDLNKLACAHIAAKHSLFTVPAFFSAEDITDVDKLATLKELVAGLTLHVQKKPHGLLGAVPGGQAQSSPPAMSETEMKQALANADGCRLNTPALPAKAERVSPDATESPTLVTILDRPPPGGWKPEDRVPDKDRKPPQGASPPASETPGDPGAAMVALMRQMMPTGGGLSSTEVRAIAEEVARAAFHALAEDFRLKLEAARFDMERYALAADDTAVEAFMKHIAKFALSPHAKEVV